MQAIAVFPSKKSLQLVEIPQPKLQGASDVLLRVREVGLCGTDREISSFEYGSPPRGSDRLILGHESLAEVVEVGRSVHSLRPGDLVVAMVRRPCPHAECRACRAGRPDFCVTGDYIERGIKGADGFLADYVVDDEEYLVRVPHVLADVAVLVEPLTVVTKAGNQARAIFDRLRYEAGPQRGLVLGAGPIGLLGAMALVADGFETLVYSRDSEESKQAATAEMNGRAIRDLVLRNKVVFGTVNAGRGDHLSAIQHLEQFMVLFPESVRKLITHRVSLDEVPQMLKQKRGIKDVVQMSRAA
jgi:threonine dehydrogenase-like Zn-dependent dehydrogenase